MQKVINGVNVKRLTTWPNYGVSKCGRAFRWDFEKELKVGLQSGRRQYLVFRAARTEGKPCWVFLHVALAEAWLENDNPELKTQVNHKDGNKLNNHISNLEWCTPAENQRHAVETGLKGRGDALYNTALSETQVHLICQELQGGARTGDLAEKYEVPKDAIRKIKEGTVWFHIRALYPIDVSYKSQFSEATVRWVCERICEGRSDSEVVKLSRNTSLKIPDVKRIRHKIRYRHISDEYF